MLLLHSLTFNLPRLIGTETSRTHLHYIYRWNHTQMLLIHTKRVTNLGINNLGINNFLTHRFRHPLPHSLIQFGEPAPIGILELETCWICDNLNQLSYFWYISQLLWNKELKKNSSGFWNWSVSLWIWYWCRDMMLLFCWVCWRTSFQ